MRTTITFADDVAALIAQRRAAGGSGISEIVNDLIRQGAVARPPTSSPKALPAFDLEFLVDVQDVGEVIALLDEQDR